MLTTVGRTFSASAATSNVAGTGAGGRLTVASGGGGAAGVAVAAIDCGGEAVAR